MAIQTFGENGLIGAGVGGALGLAVGGTVGYIAGRRSSTKRKKSKNSNRKKGNRKSKPKGRKLKFGSPAYRKKYLKHGRRKQRQPHTAGKRRDTSHRRIRYTRNNQPYIIQADGKARFISKKSAKTSHKRKGGKY